MRDQPRTRKVRGAQIRDSRDEKQQQSAHSSTSQTDQASRQTTQASIDLSEQVLPDTESFVETEAVTQLKQRLTRWMDAGRPTHLIGPTGCGKTALAMQAASDRDRPVVWINGDADLTTSDLIGEYGETERISERDQYIHNVVKSKDIIRDQWVDNPLTIAAREGATLVYNEFSRTKPVANNILLSVFEEGILELPGQRGDSRYVDVHPEFRAILTSNSIEYAGVHQPQDALLDRLIGIHMDFYDHETEVQIVKANVADIPKKDIDQVVQLIRHLREQLDINVGTRAAIMTVEGIIAVESITQSVLVDICTDVLGSKVSTREELAELRATITTSVTEVDPALLVDEPA